MSRAYSGKTSIAVIAWRIAAFNTLAFLFLLWVFYDGILSGGDVGFVERVVGLVFWWTFCQFGGFLSAFQINLVLRLIFNFYFQSRPEYVMWLREGGSPFWDILPWPFNTDSNTVRMAISRPPDYDVCPRDGYPLGRRFGNQCRHCGLYYDKG